MIEAKNAGGAQVRVRLRPSALFVCAVLVGSIACSSYVPAPIQGVAPETKVAVVLTATGTDSLARALGAGVSRVTGVFTGMNGDAIVLRVSGTEGVSTVERRWNSESVALPRRFVSSVERSQFSRLRTGLATVGVIGAIAVLNAGFGGGGHSGGVSGAGSQGGK